MTPVVYDSWWAILYFTSNRFCSYWIFYLLEDNQRFKINELMHLTCTNISRWFGTTVPYHQLSSFCLMLLLLLGNLVFYDLGRNCVISRIQHTDWAENVIWSNFWVWSQLRHQERRRIVVQPFCACTTSRTTCCGSIALTQTYFMKNGTFDEHIESFYC